MTETDLETEIMIEVNKVIPIEYMYYKQFNWWQKSKLWFYVAFKV